jgi:hypothetical protein
MGRGRHCGQDDDGQKAESEPGRALESPARDSHHDPATLAGQPDQPRPRRRSIPAPALGYLEHHRQTWQEEEPDQAEPYRPADHARDGGKQGTPHDCRHTTNHERGELGATPGDCGREQRRTSHAGQDHRCEQSVRQRRSTPAPA